MQILIEDGHYMKLIINPHQWSKLKKLEREIKKNGNKRKREII